MVEGGVGGGLPPDPAPVVLPFALADDGASLTSRVSQRASTRLLASRTRPSSSGVEAQHFQQAPGARPEAGDGEAEVLVGRFSFVSRVASQCPRAPRERPTLNPQPSTLLKGSDPLEGLLPESDVVVVSAGSSVGARDETPAALERSASRPSPVRVNDVDAKRSNSAAFCFLFDPVQVGLQVLG
jgi:hypothetical protein